MYECPLKLAYLLGFKSCMWIYPYFHWLICLYLICDIYVKLVYWLFIRTKFFFTWKKSEQNFLYKWWITWNKVNTAVLLNNIPKALLNSIFLLRVPWTTRRSNQSILKKISPGTSLEGMMLKVKLQYFGQLMWRVDSLEKTLILGGIGSRGKGDDRGWDGWMASPTRWTWVWVNSGSWWWTGRPGVLWFMGSQRVGHNRATELNWTELNSIFHWLNGHEFE